MFPDQSESPPAEPPPERPPELPPPEMGPQKEPQKPEVEKVAIPQLSPPKRSGIVHPEPPKPPKNRDISYLLFPTLSFGLWIYPLFVPAQWPIYIFASLATVLLGLTLVLLRFQTRPIQTLNLLLCITSLACLPFAAGGLFVTQQLLKKNEARKETAPSPPKPPKENISPEEQAEALRLQVAKDHGAEETTTYEKEIRGLLERKEFRELETRAAELKATPTRFPKTGIWKPRAFYDGLNRRAETTPKTLEEDLRLLEEWKKAEPRSTTPLNAETEVWLEYAWAHRGTGPSSTVNQENREAFEEKLKKAQDSLFKSKDLAPRDQQWYYQALQIGIAKQCDSETLTELSQEGMRKYPEDYLIPQIHSAGLSEKWGGRKGDWENYAMRLSNGSPLGNEIYTWIVLTHEKDYTKIFQESQADWKKTKAGLESLLEKYPQWAWLQNQAAYLAVLGGDRDFALRQFTTLGDHYLPEVWGQPERFTHFRNWAKTGQW